MPGQYSRRSTATILARAVAVLAVAALAACSGASSDAEPAGTTIAVPEGTTFCSAWSDLDGEQLKFIAFGQEGWQDWIDGLVLRAEIVEAVAPSELAAAAADNTGYYRSQAAVESSAPFVDGNLEIFEYGRANC